MTTHPLDRVTVDVPQPGPGELLVAVHACGVCRTDLHVAEGDLPVHRPRGDPGPRGGRARSAAIGPGRRRTSSRSVTASASRGCGTRAGTAGSASAGRRTSAPNPATPAGTPTAATPNSPLSQRRSRTICPSATPTPNWRRCCAPASSATARCCAPTCRPAAGWASTGSAAAPISPPRSLSRRERRCTS